MTNEERWLKNYELAKKYYEEHGNLLIPQNYVCKDEDGNKVKLGIWIDTQRNAYKGKGNAKLNQKQIDLLNEIEMIWEVRNTEESIPRNWLKNYNLAQKYYEEHGNLLIPYNYVCRDEEGNEVKLGRWISTQRLAYKEKGSAKLNQKQIDLLNEIEMIWEVRNTEESIPRNWLKNYNLAKKYYEEHGNLLIPNTYVCKDKEGKEVKLGRWISTQRRAYKGNGSSKLNQKQIELLNEIEMVWDIRNNEELIPRNWLKKYKLAQKYYEEHGNLLIPYNYVCRDEEGNEVKLGRWISTQRLAYKEKGSAKLNQKQIALLNEIEMVWEVIIRKDKVYNLDMIKNNDWKKYYLMLKEYKDTYGDLFVLESFVYKDKDNNLYNWLKTQKNILSKKTETNKIKIGLLNDVDSNWKSIDINNLKSYIEEEYMYYSYGLLDEKNVNKLLNSGAFIYTDDKEIVKATEESFLSKIKLR